MAKVKKRIRNKLNSAALAYARRGRPVLPLHSVKDGRCGCGKVKCPSPGKHPLLPNGLRGASKDRQQIKEWWRRWPNANVGIRTGAESGLVVVDIDPRNGGEITLANLIKNHGPLPSTPKANSGGGGWHIYFEYPGKKFKGRNDFPGPGIDIKADGGYIIAPPSLHVSGKTYQWAEGASLDDLDLAALPKWLQTEKVYKPKDSIEGSTKVIEGDRNDTLTSLAGYLRRQSSSEADIFNVLMAANTTRCEPPLSEVEVRKISASVATYPTDESGNDSQATRLVKLANGIELFHGPDKQAYAVLRVRKHKECWSITSSHFEHWLRGRYYHKYRTAPSSPAYQSALGVLISKAIYDGPEQEVYIRVAGNRKKVVIDLGDADWSAVEVTARGWKLLREHPVRFVRSATMRPLPVPVKGGNLNELRKFLNLACDADWVLVVSWLIAALLPEGPYPILVVLGEQGAAKTTNCIVLCMIVDPHQPALRSLPATERDLMISAARSWILAFDNVSWIKAAMSDALCRLATGAGYTTRKLYSDSDEQVFNAKRALILNGISELASRPDLLDRAITLVLPPISQSARQTEADFWRAFETERPKILGALLDAVSVALRRFDDVKLEGTPRMADFARWAVAAEPALGVKPGSFMRAYLGNRQTQHVEAVAASPIGPGIQKFIDEQMSWSGTAQELLHEISKECFTDYRSRERRDWPRTPRGMSSALRRLAPSLRMAGIDVEFLGKTGHMGSRIITLTKTQEEPPEPPAPPAETPKVRMKPRIKWKKDRFDT